MIETPAFNVRSYPPFRMARLHRVYVDLEAHYLIRMRGFIGNADAGSRFERHPGRALTGMFLRWWARSSLDAAARQLDARAARDARRPPDEPAGRAGKGGGVAPGAAATAG